MGTRMVLRATHRGDKEHGGRISVGRALPEMMKVKWVSNLGGAGAPMGGGTKRRGKSGDTNAMARGALSAKNGDEVAVSDMENKMMVTELCGFPGGSVKGIRDGGVRQI